MIRKNVLLLLLLLPASGHRPADLVSRNHVQIIAHRGASGLAPENTLAAFRKAVEDGAGIIELDVHQSRDSLLVVIHDETIDRTTDGEGMVDDHSAAEIRDFDAGSWFSARFAGEKVPLLAEVFDAIPDSIILLIEIKEGSDRFPKIEERVVAMVRGKRAERRVILKSFEDAVLERLRAIAPDIPRLKIIVTQFSFLGIIVERGVSFGTVLNDSVQYLQHHWFGLTRSFIDAAHQEGYRVFVWDVHDEERMQEMIEMGVDGIETDYPGSLKRLLAGR